MLRMQLRIIVVLLAMGGPLHVTGDSLEHLSHALQKLAVEQPPQDRPERVEEVAEQPHPFATHLLLILIDTTEKGEKGGAMLTTAKQAFKSNVPFLVTETLLRAFMTAEKRDLPANYRYFRIRQNTTPPFLLCIPSITETTSNFGRKWGLLIDWFEEVTERVIDKSHQLSDKYNISGETIGRELRNILESFFMPAQSYMINREESPRWIIIFSGHGSQYTPYSDAEIMTSHKFIKKYGSISYMDSENFAATIRMLHSRINLALLYIDTCFGGGINVGNLLYDPETGVLPPYPWIVITGTLTGDSCTSGYEEARFDLFFNSLKNIKISTDEPKSKELYEKIPQALDHITLNQLHYYLKAGIQPKDIPYIPYNMPIVAIRPASTNYFVELQFPDRIPFKRIDKHTVKQYTDKTFDVPHSSVLLYTNTVPFTIRATGKELLAHITSAIPGSTFHVITGIEMPGIKKIYNNKKLFHFTTERIFPDITIETANVTKLFHVKKLSIKKFTYELRIIKEPEGYTALRTSLTKPGKFILFDKKSAKTISAQTAAEWIKKFDEKIVFLKKLANAQAPYRFLKDADIETLPWD